MKTKEHLQYLLIVLFIFSKVQSTTMFELALEDLATGSEKVVQATVTKIVTKWDKNEEVIYTYIRMNIVDDLIGDDEDNEIIIKQPGGTIGDISLAVEGTTKYSEGEENILFLFTDPDNLAAFQTLGMYQGKYIIYTDSSGVRRVTQDTNGHVTLIRKNGRESLETGDNYTLNDFKTKVLDYIGK